MSPQARDARVGRAPGCETGGAEMEQTRRRGSSTSPERGRVTPPPPPTRAAFGDDGDGEEEGAPLFKPEDPEQPQRPPPSIGARLAAVHRGLLVAMMQLQLQLQRGRGRGSGGGGSEGGGGGSGASLPPVVSDLLATLGRLVEELGGGGGGEDDDPGTPTPTGAATAAAQADDNPPRAPRKEAAARRRLRRPLSDDDHGPFVRISSDDSSGDEDDHRQRAAPRTTTTRPSRKRRVLFPLDDDEEEGDDNEAAGGAAAAAAPTAAPAAPHRDRLDNQHHHHRGNSGGSSGGDNDGEDHRNHAAAPQPPQRLRRRRPTCIADLTPQQLQTAIPRRCALVARIGVGMRGPTPFRGILLSPCGRGWVVAPGVAAAAASAHTSACLATTVFRNDFDAADALDDVRARGDGRGNDVQRRINSGLLRATLRLREVRFFDFGFDEARLPLGVGRDLAEALRPLESFVDGYFLSGGGGGGDQDDDAVAEDDEDLCFTPTASEDEQEEGGGQRRQGGFAPRAVAMVPHSSSSASEVDEDDTDDPDTDDSDEDYRAEETEESEESEEEDDSSEDDEDAAPAAPPPRRAPASTPRAERPSMAMHLRHPLPPPPASIANLTHEQLLEALAVRKRLVRQAGGSSAFSLFVGVAPDLHRRVWVVKDLRTRGSSSGGGHLQQPQTFESEHEAAREADQMRRALNVPLKNAALLEAFERLQAAGLGIRV